MSFTSLNKDTHVIEVYEDKEASFRTRGIDHDSRGPTFDADRTAKLLRKMDFNIVPFLALLYL